jgi:geranylgeranyl diphosphate synthase type II
VNSKEPDMIPQAVQEAVATPGPLAQVEAQLALLLPAESDAPQALHRAMRYAVLEGGKRLRPLLLLSVARACAATEEERELALLAACAVELVHCASLVHDDLPSFDDAATRRGRPTVHVRFGEPVAVLTGDALLTLGFDVLAQAPQGMARRALRIVQLLARAAGSKEGIIGGQGLEDREQPLPPEHLVRYHEMKTAALFRFAAEAGAVAAGAADAAAWAETGALLGLAYQLADDLVDVCGKAEAAGKPVGQDAAHHSPNAVHAVGTAAARERLRALLDRCRARVTELATNPAVLLDLIDMIATAGGVLPEAAREAAPSRARALPRIGQDAAQLIASG